MSILEYVLYDAGFTHEEIAIILREDDKCMNAQESNYANTKKQQSLF